VGRSTVRNPPEGLELLGSIKLHNYCQRILILRINTTVPLIIFSISFLRVCRCGEFHGTSSPTQCAHGLHISTPAGTGRSPRCRAPTPDQRAADARSTKRKKLTTSTSVTNAKRGAVGNENGKYSMEEPGGLPEASGFFRIGLPVALPWRSNV